MIVAIIKAKLVEILHAGQKARSELLLHLNDADNGDASQRRGAGGGGVIKEGAGVGGVGDVRLHLTEHISRRIFYIIFLRVANLSSAPQLTVKICVPFLCQDPLGLWIILLSDTAPLPYQTQGAKSHRVCFSCN